LLQVKSTPLRDQRATANSLVEMGFVSAEMRLLQDYAT
jgi:hypothetical protein